MEQTTKEILERGEARSEALTEDDLAHLVSLETGSDDEKALFSAAYRVKCRIIGKRVSIRGLIESGNICAKDCLYCGIRRSNANVERYSLTEDEIVALARQAKEFGYASIVIQSGEIESEGHTAFIENVLRRISPLELGVTLSLGEQTEEAYLRWKEAGALRYLLRIETSNPELYAKLHPADHKWERRRDCLLALGRCGYQVGTGVMIGLPGQTAHDLARDIAFFREIGAHMIGMGPWIPHRDAPLGHEPPLELRSAPLETLSLGLRMIAATRLYLHDANIAAATALQALAEDGREKGILAGANVIMPNMTDTKYRRAYQLYDGKPCLGENAELCRHCLDRRLDAIGEKILYNERGDSLRYMATRATVQQTSQTSR